MCGIAGIVSAQPMTSLQQERLLYMSDAMVHRGPDGAGSLLGSHVSLAMRRLSIIDLSGGWQPLYNEDKSLVLIANGEIYNFVELRSQLESQGHRFRSRSDVEVIVHLYEEYSERCVDYLRGMFAFALWDERRKNLFLARDRMGEKPLYLFEQADTLYFASELKALLRTGVVDFQLDRAAVYQYFHFQYVPEPMTMIKGVRKLSAGTTLTISPQPWSLRESRYWSMDDAPRLDNDPVSTIRTELERVSELIVRSDVPVGVALSGGLDSSALAALVARAYPGRLTAFTVGYEGRPRFDERREANAIADYLSIPLHEVEIKTEDMVNAFPSLVWQTDDPIADIASYGYSAVMSAAHQHGVPVMLSGQGGDELFWGYPWVTDALGQTMRKACWQSEARPKFGQYVSLKCPSVRSRWDLFDWCRSGAGLRSSYLEYLRDLQSPRERIVFHEQSPLFRTIRDSVPSILTEEFLDSAYELALWKPYTVPHPWSRPDILFTRLLCETYLAENGIAQSDRLSMASSVELRLPLVDFRLVETVIGLRKAYPDHDLPPKAWFKAAVKELVPEWLLHRPKRGFQPPGREWMQSTWARYGHALEDGLLVQHSILKPETAYVMAKQEPRSSLALLTFTALVLEYWCAAQIGHAPESVFRSVTPSRLVSRC
ncbi:MAG: asparagine synthase (glutamine-hydrolyzing) [Nitrospira sp.]|nr:asparagine synthase (glutamine-hydrolyzing) [Nitrospira sp.]